MSANLQSFIAGVTKRLGDFAQASPFKGNPLEGAASAFQNPFGGAQSPFQNTQLAVGNPFSNPMNPTASPFTNQLTTHSPFAGSGFNVGSPFNGGAFGVSSPFGNSFGNVSSPFGGSPFNFGNPAAMEAAARRGQQQNGGSGSGNGTSGGGMDFSGPATADDNEGITAEQVDAFIRSKFPNSPLAGQGATLLNEANRNGVSVLMMLGIAWKESGLGSNVGKGNIWGITDPSTDGGIGKVRTFQHWGSLGEEIAAAARLLGSSTYRGKSAADQISTWYVGRPYAGNAGADDAAGNGTVDNYLDNFIAPTYAAFGKGYNKTQAPTARNTGAPPDGGVSDGQYVFPVDGYTSQVHTHHDAGEVGATDLFAPEGTPVRAMRGGRVTYVGNDSVGGWNVMIQGDDGNQYYYAHLYAQPLVAVGTVVRAGTHIGGVGDTGNAKGTGTHLHIGVGRTIQNGVGPQGGAGTDFNLVGVLQNILNRNGGSR